MPTSPRALVLVTLLPLSPACGLVDPDAAPELAPTLILACEHPNMWFEGLHTGPDGVTAYPAAQPYRPAALHTQLARAEWDGPRGTAAQTACADVCVGTAGPGFYYQCPDAGWKIDAELTLAPAPALLDDHLDPDACYPDSACAAAFAAPVGAHLRAPAAPIPVGRGQADHIGVSDNSLELQLAGARASHPLHGLAEYSAGECGDDRCLFYLANLQLEDRGARSQAQLGLATSVTSLNSVAASLHGLRIELMQPALADYTPSTGALHFPAGSLDLRIRLAVAAGGLIDPGERELRIRNPVALSGRFFAGTFELEAELPLAALGLARLALDFRPRANPPIAGFDPPARLHGGTDGLLLPHDPAVPSPLHAAHDPDGDLRALHWVVDGVPGVGHVPPGEHDVQLFVVDERGALGRSPVRTVTILAAR